MADVLYFFLLTPNTTGKPDISPPQTVTLAVWKNRQIQDRYRIAVVSTPICKRIETNCNTLIDNTYLTCNTFKTDFHSNIITHTTNTISSTPTPHTLEMCQIYLLTPNTEGQPTSFSAGSYTCSLEKSLYPNLGKNGQIY